MTVDERLRTPRLKVKRAYKHIVELDAEIGSFFATDPYSVAFNHDLQPGKVVYYLQKAAPIPDSIPLIAGDAIANLRSALDHLAWQLFLVGGGGTEKQARDVYFPIFETAEKFEAGAGRKIECMREDAQKMIRSLKPYKGGNSALWSLAKLNDIDKHRLIVTAGAQFTQVVFGAKRSKRFPGIDGPGGGFRGLDFNLIDPYGSFPLKAGQILLVDDSPEPDEHPQFAFAISFGEPGVIKSKPVVEALQQISDFIRRIFTMFKPCLSE